MRRAIQLVIATSIAALAFVAMTGVAQAHANLLSSIPRRARPCKRPRRN